MPSRCPSRTAACCHEKHWCLNLRLTCQFGQHMLHIQLVPHIPANWPMQRVPLTNVDCALCRRWWRSACQCGWSLLICASSHRLRKSSTTPCSACSPKVVLFSFLLDIFWLAHLYVRCQLELVLV